MEHDQYLSPKTARQRLVWQDCGIEGGEKTLRLFFLDDDQRRLCFGEISRQAQAGQPWFVEGSNASFKSLIDARKQAVSIAIDRLRDQGYVQMEAN